ncbi:MAG: GNAT family N-acetyltransferase [Phycisphaerales bacterium]|nr:GNAT family N-acetyltransferase [Phycisphaerales bacterium]
MDEHPSDIIVRVAIPEDAQYAEIICKEIEDSAKIRGTGIAKRSVEYIVAKICLGKSVVAIQRDGTWVGFSYMDSYENDSFVSNSSLIVAPAYRNTGIAKRIKQMIFDLSRKTYPHAKIFSITTGLAVMKMNSELGYVPVTFAMLPQENNFWDGCKGCVNYSILSSKNRKNCLCTALLYDPQAKNKKSLSNDENE